MQEIIAITILEDAQNIVNHGILPEIWFAPHLLMFTVASIRIPYIIFCSTKRQRSLLPTKKNMASRFANSTVLFRPNPTSSVGTSACTFN